MDETEQQIISNFMSQTLIGVLCHPMEYSKVLIQLGHEPIAPRVSTTFFGRPTLILPNVFQYIRYIKRTDGFFGCFNGLMPTIFGNIASATFTMKVIKGFSISWPEIEDPPNLITEGEPKQQDYANYARKEMTLHAVSIMISYPFRVVTIRMMASFIGKEENYQSMFSAIAAIYRDNGFSGFFQGIVPKLIGDLSCIGASVFLAYIVNKYMVKTKESRGYTLPVLTFLISNITYPLMLTSTCMAVNGSSLIAGKPPRMPKYSTWRACLSDLVQRKQHKRGGALIFRSYVDPKSI